MKRILTLVTLIGLLVLGCTKDELKTQTTQDVSTSLTARTVDWRNPNPTWIQVTSPTLRPAKWNDYTFAGFTAGLPGPYNTTQKFQIYDTTIVMKWHLHVGTRYFNGKWKPDVIDYRFYYINGDGQDFKKSIPNGGVMGDYDFVDTIKIDKWGYYNWMYAPNMGYDASYQLYDWNGVTPSIHSAATNGWLDDPLMTQFLRP